ncbi:unnamed protein product [Merluccius merluccius]
MPVITTERNYVVKGAMASAATLVVSMGHVCFMIITRSGFHGDADAPLSISTTETERARDGGEKAGFQKRQRRAMKTTSMMPPAEDL